jgi:hypothetical protein
MGRRLFEFAAEISQQAAWVSFDVGRHAAAQQYWLTAVRFAHRAGNRELGANAVSFLSYQAYSLGNAQDASWLIDFVLDRVRPNMTPRLAAHIYGRKALAASLLGDAATVRRAADHALSNVEHVGQDEPPWTTWIDRAQLEGMTGRAYLGLRDAAGAQGHLSEAISQTVPRSRSQALYVGQLAQAALLEHDLEQAATHGLTALDIAAGVESPRVMDQIALLDHRMKQHANNPWVRDFHEAYRASEESRRGSSHISTLP